MSGLNEPVTLLVAPFVGAWIETGKLHGIFSGRPTVAPFVGAWIETCFLPSHVVVRDESLPSWERGLKLSDRPWSREGWNVAPFVGAWIETT